MGTDKGLMMFNGKLIIQHIIDQVQPVVDRVVIVSNNPEYRKSGLEVIPDIIPDSGPAGGIHAALMNSSSERNFMVSCDMPFIRSAAILYLLSQPSDAEIIIPVHDGKTEPLFGLYSKAVLPRWDAFIRRGFLKLQELIACFNLLKLDVGGNPLFNDPLFDNINTPEDLEKALTNLKV